MAKYIYQNENWTDFTMKKHTQRSIILVASFIICIMLFGCHSGNQTVGDGTLILLDANQDKARIDLRITDIADVYLIPLQFGQENVLLNVPNARRSLFVFHDEIFIGNWLSNNPRLIVFNFQGEPLRTIGSRGRGPGEYLKLKSFFVDTLANEIFIYDDSANKFMVFSTTGKFKRERLLEHGLYNQFTDIENINDQYMLAYKSNSKEMSDKTIEVMGIQIAKENELCDRGKVFTLYDKQTLTEVVFSDFEYAKPARFAVFTLFSYLTTTRDGIYITNPRTDTIYFMNRDLKLSPRFVDITDYPDKRHDAHLLPVAETNKYIFYSVELESNPENQNLYKHFVFDKEKKQLFRLNTGLSEGSTMSIRSALIKNTVAFDQYMLSLNHDYVSTLITPEYLYEHNNELPNNFKEITKSLKIDDNPVLILMKLR